jgi:ornithine cyclodeaminase/alanine dehydrogenase-like protein (mu-crystallin family)
MVEAALLDNGYLTDVRTAAAGGVGGLAGAGGREPRRHRRRGGAGAAAAAGAQARFPELGSVLAGQTHGRAGADEITLADLTGTGVQDTAIATLALARAREQGAGRTFAT